MDGEIRAALNSAAAWQDVAYFVTAGKPTHAGPPEDQLNCTHGGWCRPESRCDNYFSLAAFVRPEKLRIKSSGNGKTIVELFCAAIVLRVPR